MKNNVVIYDATTHYMLMNAWLTAKLKHDVDYNVLYLNTALIHDAENVKNRLMSTDVFQEVILIRDSLNYTVRNLLNNLPKAPSCYHFMCYGAHYAVQLFMFCQQQRIPIILTDEGMATYSPFKSYQRFYELFQKNGLQPLDLQAVDEIWVLNKSWFTHQVSQNIVEIPLRAALFNPILRNEIVSGLNKVFAYEHQPIIEKNIFFTQNFYTYGTITPDEQVQFFASIAMKFQDGLAFKLHPAESIHFYQHRGLRLLDLSNSVPWELVLMNQLIDQQTQNLNLISVGSTSIFSKGLLYNDDFSCNINSIALFDLSPTSIKELITESRFEEVRSIGARLTNCYFPRNWEEFDLILNELAT